MAGQTIYAGNYGEQNTMTDIQLAPQRIYLPYGAVIENITDSTESIRYEDITDYRLRNFAEREFETEFALKILENKLLRTFKIISNVNSIYIDSFKAEAQIFVMLTGDKYDDNLMDELLDAELNIRDQIPKLGLDFQYIPQLGEVDSDLISNAAKLVYRKG